jgi:beta-fructofuranosidase
MKKIKRIENAVEHSRLLREKFLNDPYRPGYHFVVPEDIGMPGDPNGAFFANGRYHLMYLYACRSDNFRWGHISSIDLIHWRSHPDAVLPDDLDGGIFSGGAFLDDDGTCYMTYWGLPVKGKNQGGVRIIKSCDRHYEQWEKFADYVLPCTESGVHESQDANGSRMYLGCADPSNIWKKDGTYYMQMGNLSVLLKFKRDGLHDWKKDEPGKIEVPANIRGDWVDLFKSKDLVNWEYAHRFYERNQENTWTAVDEDDMCPSFLPLPKARTGGEPSGKYLQLFISHNKGCQYYIGDYDKANDVFIPETHGRMTWTDNTFFAPEALVDPKGRQIMWSWLLDNPKEENKNGWSGVYGLPRVLWLRDDNTLGIAPVPELEMLRYNEVSFGEVCLEDEEFELQNINGTSCEIKLTIDTADLDETGIYLRASADFSEYTKIYYDRQSQKLVFDASHSGQQGRPIVESAPLELAEGEKLVLDIFVDKTVIEVFANDKQAICRRVYPEKQDSVHLYLYSTGSTVFEDATIYEMMPSNFC